MIDSKIIAYSKGKRFTEYYIVTLLQLSASLSIV